MSERKDDEREKAAEFERARALERVIDEYLLGDKEFIYSEHADLADRISAVNALLMSYGYDEDAILLEAGIYEDVDYHGYDGKDE